MRISIAATSARARSRPVMATRAPSGGEPQGGGLADAGASAGDQDALACHRRVVLNHDRLLSSLSGRRRLHCRRPSGVGGTNRRDDIWQKALRRPEPLGDQPDAKGDFKESTRERQQERNMDPEDLGDRTSEVDRVADDTPQREGARDHSGPEQEPGHEQGPERQRPLAKLEGEGIRLREERPERGALDRAGAGDELGKGDQHEQEQHTEVQEDHLDRDRGEVDERGALATALGDREEQHALPDVDHGVEEHEEGANEEDGRVRREGRHEVRRGRHGADKPETDAVHEEPGEEQRPEDPREPLSWTLGVIGGEVGGRSRVADPNVGCHGYSPCRSWCVCTSSGGSRPRRLEWSVASAGLTR